MQPSPHQATNLTSVCRLIKTFQTIAILRNTSTSTDTGPRFAVPSCGDRQAQVFHLELCFKYFVTHFSELPGNLYKAIVSGDLPLLRLSSA